jgi:hypothetical protein
LPGGRLATADGIDVVEGERGRALLTWSDLARSPACLARWDQNSPVTVTSGTLAMDTPVGITAEVPIA